MLASHTLAVIHSDKANIHHLFSRGQLYANEQRQDTATTNGNADGSAAVGTPTRKPTAQRPPTF